MEERNGELVVEVTPEDFKNAPGFYHSLEYFDSNGRTGGCALWQALHRIFPERHLRVSGYTVDMQDGEMEGYSIDPDWGDSASEYPGWRISELCKEAKKSLEGIPTVSLTLKRTS